MSVDEAAIRERVAFEIKLNNLKGNHTSFATLSFTETRLGTHTQWLHELLDALRHNTTCTTLDLSRTGIDDRALRLIVVALTRSDVAPKLATLDLRRNCFSVAGETMLQGLRLLRSTLAVILDDNPSLAPPGDFVHEKRIVEGLSAWPADSLRIEGTQDLRCPQEVCGGTVLVPLQKGFQGANGIKYTCDDAEFELSNSTGNLVLKRLELEARMRLLSNGAVAGDSAAAARGHGVLV